MEIEVKYKIGDCVWYMKDNHISSGTISGIFTIIKKDGCNDIKCTLNTSDIKIDESELYNSKDELKNKLYEYNFN